MKQHNISVIMLKQKVNAWFGQIKLVDPCKKKRASGASETFILYSLLNIRVLVRPP